MDIELFALHGSRDFGERVAAELGKMLAEHEEREFEDGEHKARPLCNVRGRDVFVIHSLYGDDQRSADEKLVRLLFFAAALKDAAAARVTAVVPYLCYGRKDRKSKARDPVTTRYIAALLEAAGVDRVLTLDAHNLAAYQNAFRIVSEHLEATGLFARFFRERTAGSDVVAVSPDIGGVKRAEAFRQRLEQQLGRSVSSAFMEKHRSSGKVSGEGVVGDVAGRAVVIVDDLISSGTTMARAIEACRDRGAAAVFAAASHGLFAADAVDRLASPALTALAVTDSIPPFRVPAGALRDKLAVLSVAPLFASAIRCIHSGDSIVALLEG